ncbi:hypothetical protein BC628DRAFT_91385 [Trametes gibbosa]|nr:hypothetical protein BC628DRAFT_91385 [Trametes gibbosa]
MVSALHCSYARRCRCSSPRHGESILFYAYCTEKPVYKAAVSVQFPKTIMSTDFTGWYCESCRAHNPLSCICSPPSPPGGEPSTHNQTPSQSPFPYQYTQHSPHEPSRYAPTPSFGTPSSGFVPQHPLMGFHAPIYQPVPHYSNGLSASAPFGAAPFASQPPPPSTPAQFIPGPAFTTWDPALEDATGPVLNANGKRTRTTSNRGSATRGRGGGPKRRAR